MPSKIFNKYKGLRIAIPLNDPSPLHATTYLEREGGGLIMLSTCPAALVVVALDAELFSFLSRQGRQLRFWDVNQESK